MGLVGIACRLSTWRGVSSGFRGHSSLFAGRCGKAIRADVVQSEVSYIDFRVGQIVSAEKHDSSDKLLVEMIDVGESGGPRQICSGIAPWFSPEEIIGRRVI